MRNVNQLQMRMVEMLANKLGKEVDMDALVAAAERKGIDRQYDVEAHPAYDQIGAELQEAGPSPITNSFLDDIINYYIPQPQSLGSERFQERMMGARNARAEGDSRQAVAQEFKDDYTNQVIDDMKVNNIDMDDDDGFDDIIIAAGLGSLLTGAGIKEAADYETDEERLQQGRDQGYIA